MQTIVLSGKLRLIHDMIRKRIAGVRFVTKSV